MRARTRMPVAKLFSLPMRSCGHKESIFSFLPHPLIRLCSRPFIRRFLPIDQSIHLSLCPSVLPVESSSIHTLMPTSTSSHRSRHTSLHPSSRIQETPGNRREVLEIGQFPLKAFFKEKMKPFRTQRPPGPQKAQIRCSGHVAGSGQLLFK